jgi:hypothetical protein
MQAILDTKTSPLISALFKRVSEWRGEIGVKTCPDPEALQQAFDRANKEGIKEAFFVYVVGGCEWYFRVLRPNSVVLRKAIRHRLNTKEYSPYGMGFLNKDRLQTPGVTPIVNKYVDQCLSELWNGHASELSRFSLKNRIDELVRKFDLPFLASTLHPLSPKKGGYHPLAPWIAGTVIYQSLRKNYPQKQDQTPKEISLQVISALTGKVKDDSQFHRKRRVIEQRFGKFIEEQKGEWGTNIAELFHKEFENFAMVRRESIERLMEHNNPIEIAWPWLQNYGLKLAQEGE